VDRAVFLDRDGVVLNATVRDGKPYPPAELKASEFAPGAHDAMHRLKRAGFLLILITNQPDVARGSQSRLTVEAINQYVCGQVPIDDCFVCYHDDRDACDCRKPLPGLILRAAKRYSINLKGSFVIGDRWRDIDAGYAAGCRTAWIDFGYCERLPTHPPDITVKTLTDAVGWILLQAPQGI
jgi:D-glycero-D-manno-heptose 1,7-bisphosphate phosphatase